MTICDQNDNPHPNANKLMLDVADCQQVPAEVRPASDRQH